MFDLCGLPRDVPGFDEGVQLSNPYDRVDLLEQRLSADIGHQRFVPYIQLHEFEALLFVRPKELDWVFIEHGAAIRRLQVLADQHPNPELINDGVSSAPSKRIASEIPEYADPKASAGPLTASKIGIEAMRKCCPHFDHWIGRIVQLG